MVARAGQATGGCAAPIHLHGASRVLDRDGAVLLERSGTVLAPCGNRREACARPARTATAADAFHLLRAGLAGDDTKGVPATVAEHPRAFLTLTAPSFGPVHTRAVTPRGHVRRAAAESATTPTTRASARALDPDSYDYDGAVLWQAHAGMLWARFTIALRRALAAALGVGARVAAARRGCRSPRSPSTNAAGWCTSTPSSASTAPTDPPTHPRPAWTTPPSVTPSTTAARHTLLSPCAPDGEALELVWGRQLDVRPVPPAAARQLEDDDTGEMTDAALAGYIAKYATKGTGAHDGVDRPIRDIAHVEHLRLPDHHRRMIATAWDLGGRDEYEALNLRRWAHMLGFRGHFFTKSRRYSSTFGAIRGRTPRTAPAHRAGRTRLRRRGPTRDRSRHRHRDQRLVAYPLRSPRRRRTRTRLRHRRMPPSTTQKQDRHEERRRMSTAHAHQSTRTAKVVPLTYTVEEVAQLLSLSRGITYASLRDGTIPAERVGRRWVISRRRLHAWLDGLADR